jgi:hypothetical protein
MITQDTKPEIPKRPKEVSPDVLAQHLQSFGVSIQRVTCGDYASPCYDASDREVYGYPAPSSLQEYWETLHEVGHAVMDHWPEDWDGEAMCEIEAWEFVEQNSIVAVPKSEIRRWEKMRIKGTWEMSKRTLNRLLAEQEGPYFRKN